MGTLKVFKWDGGHDIWKIRTASKENEVRHAIQEISTAEYEELNILKNGKLGPDYVIVNGRAYVVGKSAEGRTGTPLVKLTGAARYTPEYYGVVLAAMLGRMYTTGGDVEIVTSHPIRDAKYRNALLESVMGKWEVICEGRDLTFNVVAATAYDEPQALLMNLILNNDGTAYGETAIQNRRALVLDIGGGTTQLLSASVGGWADYEIHDTIQLGIGNILADFEGRLRSDFDVFQDSPTLDPRMLRDALVNGFWDGGGGFPVRKQSEAAKNLLLGQIAMRYQQKAGGPANWGAVVIGGGGTGLLIADLLPLLNHPKIEPAATIKQIHLACVRGLGKIRNFYQAANKAETIESN